MIIKTKTELIMGSNYVASFPPLLTQTDFHILFMLDSYKNCGIQISLNNSSIIVNLLIIYYFTFNKQVISKKQSKTFFLGPFHTKICLFRLYLILPKICGFQISLNTSSKIINLIIIYHFTFNTIK